MKILRKLIGISIAVLLDVGAGILIVHILGKIFGLAVPWYFYFIGVFFAAVLPDLDVVLEQISKGKIDAKHHEELFLHWPLIMLLLVNGFILVVSPLRSYWMATSTVSLLFHYLDDSVGEGTWIGLKWLAPFSKKYFHFFTRQNGKYYIILSEINPVRPEGYTFNVWLEKFYLQPTVRSIGGIAVFILAVLLAVFWR